MAETKKYNNNNQPNILKVLNQYLRRRDFNLKYSDDRLDLFRDIDNDQEIIDYLDSVYFKNKQIKNKKSKLSEEDKVSQKLDSIAYYLLKSEFRNKDHEKAFYQDETGIVKNNILENNKAYKRDYKIKECDREYGYPILSMYAMKRNRSNNFNGGKNKIREVFILNEYSKRNPHNKNVSESEAHDFLTQDIVKINSSNFNLYERLIYSLKDPKNVLLFLRYEYEVLSEITSFIESDVRLVSFVLDDVIMQIGFDDLSLDIINFLKDGLDYAQIQDELNKKYENKYTYDMVKYRVNEILNRISHEIKNKINKLI